MLRIGILDCSFLCSPTVFEGKIRQVSPERRALVERHRTEGGRRQSLGGGLLLQEMLAQTAREKQAASYNSFSWEKGEQGKPILRGVTDAMGHPFYVNLSHSGEMAAAVLADFEVGIDIQEQQNLPEGVAKRFFSKEEQGWLNETEEETGERFFRIWTLKEAYIKTTGLGMRTPLAEFDVTKAARQPGVVTAIGEKMFLCALPTVLQPTEQERSYALAVGGVQPYEIPQLEFLMEH